MVKHTFSHFFELAATQSHITQMHLDQMAGEFCRREDLAQGLIRKADVSDVAKVVSEVIQATAIDYRP